MDILRILPALLIHSIVSQDIPTTIPSYLLKSPESCLEVGYYFHREPASNANDPEGCYLCICQNNGTAACWLRENRKCDVEVLNRNRAVRHARVRRSPVGLSDIFFRDATRDFFDKQLPQQCDPFKSSFSDGCPPADWCLGCTVCDCDSNGRWDCHILSFCNGDDKKVRKVPLPNNMPTRKVYPNGVIPTTPKNKVGSKTKRKSTPKPPNNKNQKNNPKRPNNNVQKHKNKLKNPQKNIRKVIKNSNNSRRPNNNTTKSNINNEKRKIAARKSNFYQRNQHSGKPKSPPKRRNMIKPLQQKGKKPQPKPAPHKIIGKSNEPKTPDKLDFKQSAVFKLLDAKNKYGESKLGRKIVSSVMGKVQKMMAKQMEYLQNATRAQRSLATQKIKDCQEKKNKMAKREKRKHRIDDKLLAKEYYSLKKKRQEKYKKLYNLRKKREALDLGLNNIDLKDVSTDNPVIITTDPKDVDLSVKNIDNNVTVNTFGGLNPTNTPLTDEFSNNVLALTAAERVLRKSLVLDSSIAQSTYNVVNLDKSSSDATATTDIITIINNTSVVSSIKTKDLNAERTNEYRVILNDSKLNKTKHKKLEIEVDNKKQDDNHDNILERFDIKKNREHIKKFGYPKKHSLKKIILSNFRTESRNNLSQFTISNLQANMRELNKELTKPTKSKTNYNMFKFLRNIFTKFFSRKNGMDLKPSHKTNESHTLEILCDNIRSCYTNKHNRIALRSKIHDLNTEMKNIFRSVKIIKSVLDIINLSTNKNNASKTFLSDNIKKLDAILKGTYATDKNNSLSETQEAQISYVRECTLKFVESAGKIASILNKIEGVLYKNNKIHECQRNLRLQQKKKILNSYSKIKSLLTKYDIMQNTFMKKIYQLLTDVEKNNMITERPKSKISGKHTNNTQLVDSYSKNIIGNLSGLKDLAQIMKSNRRKRQTIREDKAIEYLLMLMEYLLKQDHPHEKAAVNDGIDLLLEAIQNAPDIKLIKKKVLDSFPTTPAVTRTTQIDLNYLKKDSNYDSNRMSKEETEKDSLKDGNNITMEQVKDDTEETTLTFYYRRFDDSDSQTDIDEYVTTTEKLAKTKNRNAERNLEEEIVKEIVSITEKETAKKSKETKKADKTDFTGINKLENGIDDMKKDEVFNIALDEAPMLFINVNKTKKTTATTATTAKFEDNTFLPLKDYKFDDDPVDDRKMKLEWIKENFGNREYRYDQGSNNKATTPTQTTDIATITNPADRSIDDISSITIELEGEQKKKKTKTDKVLNRKQMEFLNSLDYGTEKSEFDDSEAKFDEKDPGDGFSAYFLK